jgi:hypothetical protein
LWKTDIDQRAREAESMQKAVCRAIASNMTTAASAEAWVHSMLGSASSNLKRWRVRGRVCARIEVDAAVVDWLISRAGWFRRARRRRCQGDPPGRDAHADRISAKGAVNHPAAVHSKQSFSCVAMSISLREHPWCEMCLERGNLGRSIHSAPSASAPQRLMPLYQHRPRKVALAAFKTFAVEALTTFDVPRTEAERRS